MKNRKKYSTFKENDIFFFLFQSQDQVTFRLQDK